MAVTARRNGEPLKAVLALADLWGEVVGSKMRSVRVTLSLLVRFQIGNVEAGQGPSL
jgi:hypothetical protein